MQSLRLLIGYILLAGFEGVQCYIRDKKIFVKQKHLVWSFRLKEKSENVGDIYSTTDHDHCGAVVLNWQIKTVTKDSGNVCPRPEWRSGDSADILTFGPGHQSHAPFMSWCRGGLTAQNYTNFVAKTKGWKLKSLETKSLLIRNGFIVKYVKF